MSLTSRKPVQERGSEARDGDARADGRRGDRSRESLGTLFSDVVEDAQDLFRQEVELAKAEVREEVAGAGRAAGMFGAAGFAGYMVAVFLSLALAFGLANVMDAGWAALIVAGLWALAGGVLFLRGRARMSRLSPRPERTLRTLKEDAAWARHPTG
ncbi:phage holin family protein [Streptomyces sp. DSM 44917]|uniref:Phage holin family protein n=1 Tax=Streptomyces boetiae TaxID=3075541 RepID=A0ABU2L4W7_9ACTN|nr:phage holin family protein [Streptomyces sp. DSM 44917]MDT0306605.1 phage holin family protein [Streptomyces sp. DSM 44917]